MVRGLKRRTRWGALAGLAVIAVPLWAKLSLGVRFPDIVLENVSPGMVLNLRQAKGMPYVVINQSDFPVDVVVDVELPGPQHIDPKEGYEPAPVKEWVQVVPNRFRLGAGDIGTAEVILSVPNDPALIGKHYQINLHARSLGTGQLALAVNHYVRFSVGSMGPGALAKEKNRVAVGKLDLDMTPTLRLDKVPLGKSIALDALGGTLKITNRGDDPVKLKFASNRVIASLREPGWTDPPHPEWLSMKPAVVKVKPNQVKPVKLFLNIPDAPENHGQKFQFLITAELADLGIPLQYYSRVYVTTE